MKLVSVELNPQKKKNFSNQSCVANRTDVMSSHDEFVVPLYSYREFLKSSGFLQETVDEVREKIAKHDVIPKYITNGQVSQKKKCSNSKSIGNSRLF